MSDTEDYYYSRLSTKSANDSNVDDLDLEEEIVDGTEPVVHDSYKLVKCSFFLMGLVSVLPFNVFITPTDYWMYKFRDVNTTESMGIHTNKTLLQTYFFSYMTMASNLPILFMVFFNVLWGHKISATFRSITSFVVTILLFIASTVMSQINTDHHQEQFMDVTIIIIIVMNLFVAWLQSSVAGTASRFPPSYMHALITGQACSGLFPTVIQILSLLGHIHPLRSALYYFVITDFTMVLVFVIYLLSQKTEFYKYYESREDTNEEIIDKSTPIMMHIWPHALCVLLVCWATLSVFPIGVLALPRHPNTSPWTGRFFIPLCYFLVYNFSDFCGRIAQGSIAITHRYLLLILSVLRWIIVAMILLCNIHPRSNTPVVFENEVYFVFFTASLGFTNGYVLTNAMVAAPKTVLLEYRERAGFIMVMFNAVGVNIGSLMCSLLLRVL